MIATMFNATLAFQLLTAATPDAATVPTTDDIAVVRFSLRMETGDWIAKKVTVHYGVSTPVAFEAAGHMHAFELFVDGDDQNLSMNLDYDRDGESIVDDHDQSLRADDRTQVAAADGLLVIVTVTPETVVREGYARTGDDRLEVGGSEAPLR